MLIVADLRHQERVASGALFATRSAPMMPAAPARLSTTTAWLQSWFIFTPSYAQARRWVRRQEMAPRSGLDDLDTNIGLRGGVRADAVQRPTQERQIFYQQHDRFSLRRPVADAVCRILFAG
jgi:hypothetical protein